MSEKEFALTLKETKNGDAITATIQASPMEIMRAFAERYALTLEVGDVMLLQGKPYITKSGLLRLSHVHKLKSIMPKRVEINYEQQWAHYECIVTTEDGRVYRDEGFCDKREGGKRNMQAVIGTAITRARNRAIAAATAVPYCTAEELDVETQRKMVDITEAE